MRFNAWSELSRSLLTKQPDGSWRLVETTEDGVVSLEAIGCTLALGDIYNKVTLEQVLRIVSEEPR